MAVDTAQYLGALNLALPGDGDDIAEGDDQIRAFKTAAKQSFPNVAGAVTVTHAELNRLAGVSADVQGQIDAKAPLASPALTGTPTAPTAAAATSTTQLATTAFVQAAVSTAVDSADALTLSVSNSAAVSLTAGQQDATTYAGVCTWTLPASPTAGQRVGVIVANGRADNVIARNGQNIMGLAENMTVNNKNAGITLRFVNSAQGWRLV